MIANNATGRGGGDEVSSSPSLLPAGGIMNTSMKLLGATVAVIAVVLTLTLSSASYSFGVDMEASVETNAVEVNGEQFPTFEAGYDHACELMESGTEVKIKLLADAIMNNTYKMAPVPAGATLEIDLNGFNYYNNNGGDEFVNMGTLSITDTSESKDGTFGSFDIMGNMGTMNVYAGYIKHTSSDFKWGFYNMGTLNFYGGGTRVPEDDVGGTIMNAGTLNIQDGRFGLLINIMEPVEGATIAPGFHVYGGDFGGYIMFVGADGEYVPSADDAVSISGGVFHYDVTQPTDGLTPITGWLDEGVEYVMVDGQSHVGVGVDDVLTDGASIKLLSDSDDTVNIPTGVGVTIDLNGKTFTNTIVNNGELIITDSLALSTSEPVSIENVGTCTIDGGRYSSISSSGSTEIRGGTFLGELSGTGITVSGGSFADGIGTASVAEGSLAVELSESTVVVSGTKTVTSKAKVNGYYFENFNEAVEYAKTVPEKTVYIVSENGLLGSGNVDVSGLTVKLDGIYEVYMYPEAPNSDEYNPTFIEGYTTVFFGDDFILSEGRYRSSYYSTSNTFHYALYIGDGSTGVLIDGVEMRGSLNVGSDCEVTLRNSAIDGLSLSSHEESYVIYCGEFSEILIEGNEGEYTNNDVLNDHDGFLLNGSTVTIAGGQFNRFEPESLKTHVAEGYHLHSTSKSDQKVIAGEGYRVDIYNSYTPRLVMSIYLTKGELPVPQDYGYYDESDERITLSWLLEDGTVWDGKTLPEGDFILYDYYSIDITLTATQQEDGSYLLSVGNLGENLRTSAWYRNDSLVSEELSSTYTVTEEMGSGVYSVKVRETITPFPMGEASVEVIFDGGTVTFKMDGMSDSTVNINDGRVIAPEVGTAPEGYVLSWTLQDGRVWTSETIVADGDVITGSWTLDPTLVPEVSLTGLTSDYVGGSVTLTVDATFLLEGEFVYQWYLDGTEITDENGASITVTQGGTYMVEVWAVVGEEQSTTASVEVIVTFTDWNFDSQTLNLHDGSGYFNPITVGPDVTLSSDDTNIVAVSEDGGLIASVSAGTATVIATYGTVTREMTVTVTESPGTVTSGSTNAVVQILGQSEKDQVLNSVSVLIPEDVQSANVLDIFIPGVDGTPVKGTTVMTIPYALFGEGYSYESTDEWDFLVIHIKEDNTIEAPDPTYTVDGVSVTVDGFSPFVLAIVPAGTSDVPGGTPEGPDDTPSVPSNPPQTSDDDEYVPLPPQIVYEDSEGDDDTVMIIACAAAAVVAALMAVFIILAYRRQ